MLSTFRQCDGLVGVSTAEGDCRPVRYGTVTVGLPRISDPHTAPSLVQLNDRFNRLASVIQMLYVSVGLYHFEMPEPAIHICK